MLKRTTTGVERLLNLSTTEAKNLGLDSERIERMTIRVNDIERYKYKTYAAILNKSMPELFKEAWELHVQQYLAKSKN